MLTRIEDWLFWELFLRWKNRQSVAMLEATWEWMRLDIECKKIVEKLGV